MTVQRSSKRPRATLENAKARVEAGVKMARELAVERALSDALAEALRHHLVAGCSEATHADCEALSTYDDAERGK